MGSVDKKSMRYKRINPDPLSFLENYPETFHLLIVKEAYV